MKGKVHLVGAGPGDPELLTLKALRVLQSADVVLHDDLISSEILALAPRTAFLRNVGKRCGRKSIEQHEINSLLIKFASSGFQVVRLKGGDPFIFGRAGEEIEALLQHGIDCEIVPGITAALGAAASAQIPLTQREISSAVTFLTGHHAAGGHSNGVTQEDWRGYVSSGATLVIYMPGRDYQNTADRLVDAGMKGSTSCALVSRATSPDQQVYRTTVRELSSAPLLAAPVLLLVGEVTCHKEHFVRAEALPNRFLNEHLAELPSAREPSASGPRPQRVQEQLA